MERRNFLLGTAGTLVAGAASTQSAVAADADRAAGWSSSFTYNNKGWSAVRGPWYRSAGMWRADGLQDSWTSTKHGGYWSNFVYQAKVKRDGNGGGTWNNALVIRGNPMSLSSSGHWQPCYILGFSNTGYASVFRVEYDGSTYPLMSWTYFSFIASAMWKNLKVVAQNNFFAYSINGKTMWSGYDSSFSYGMVGFTFYTSSPYWSTLKMDSASLTTIAARDTVRLDPAATGGRVVKGGSVLRAPN
ncbi:MAG: hypothetical protein IPH03_06330 [Tetrasphaera sp.]|jgi:hypothetical protein|nr:hypothetical protein [Tetrasphaera sp.]